MQIEKLEAVGQRGEACLIHLTQVPSANGQTAHVYSLASGDRLRKTDQADEFETLDGRRRFKLRQPRAAES